MLSRKSLSDETFATRLQDVDASEGEQALDYAGTTVYANALAHVVSHVNPPKKIAVFAPWGSGRTCLINALNDLLQKRQQQKNLNSATVVTLQPEWKIWISAALFISISLVLLLCGILLNIPTIFLVTQNESSVIVNNISSKSIPTVSERFNVRQILSLSGLCTSVFFVILAFFVAIGARKRWFSLFTGIKMLFVGAYVKLPIYDWSSSVNTHKEEVSTDNETYKPTSLPDTRFIFVRFNAVAYTHTGILWAGIITTLITAIEKEFGTVAVRLFRRLQIVNVTPDVTNAAMNNNVVFFKCGNDISKIQSIFQQFGVVRFYKKYTRWLIDERIATVERNPSSSTAFAQWYVVGYVSYTEANNAINYLLDNNIAACSDDPFAKATQPNNSCEAEKQPLLKSSSVHETDYSNKSFGFCFLFKRYPRTACGLPLIFWATFLLFVIVLPIPLTFAASWNSEAISTVVKVLAALPLSLLTVYAVAHFVYAMFFSQTKAVASAAKLTEFSSTVTVALSIKNEITYLTHLIHCAEVTYDRKYKVLVSVDNLDKVCTDQILPLFEAFNILLSDQFSPYICLLGIDQRVALACIEKRLSQALLDAHVNPHEYLQKAFPLAFCLPQLVEKWQFKTKFIQLGNQKSAGINLSTGSTTTTETTLHQSDELDSHDFLLACRKFLQNDIVVQSHLLASTQKVKRVFDRTTITTVVVDCVKEEVDKAAIVKEVASGSSSPTNQETISRFPAVVRNQALAEQIVQWIVLTEQWPYRMNYICVVIAEADRASLIGNSSGEAISDETSLIEIYKRKVEPELPNLSPQETKLLLEDGDVATFHSFMEKTSSSSSTSRGLCKQDAKYLQIFSVNLDQSVQKGITYLRSQFDFSNLLKAEGSKPEID